MIPVPRAVFFSVLLLAVAGTGAAGQPLHRFEYTEAHMGTQFRIVLYATDVEVATGASKAAFERVAELDAIMSDYRETSELNRLTRRSGEGPVAVSPDLFRILDISQRFARLTSGAFDPTIGPVVKLWRRARRTRELPPPAQIAATLSVSGYGKMHLDPKARTVTLDTRGMQLDLGGIAKGFAADEALRVLEERGIRRALVVAGGEMAAGAPPPGRKGWTIAIAPLDPSRKEPGTFLLVSHAGVSTSGDESQHVEINGVRYSHIVNPGTGIGLTGHTSVTVVARDATTSDAMATAVDVLGPRDGLRVIDRIKGAAALFVEQTGEGPASHESKRWKNVPQTGEAPGRDE